FDINQTGFSLPTRTQFQADAPESAVEVCVLGVVSERITGANQAGQFDEHFIALFRLSYKERSASLFNELLDCAAAAPLLVFLIEPLKFGDIAGHKILIQSVNRGSGLFKHFPHFDGSAAVPLIQPTGIGNDDDDFASSGRRRFLKIPRSLIN